MNVNEAIAYIHLVYWKGSTASMTASILQKAGYRTGLYTIGALREALDGI